jgi:RNA polymerase sigma-70 factor (ECF subfamily)
MSQRFAQAVRDEIPVKAEHDSDRFQRDLVALIPELRGFARMLCRRKPVAEDLAQEALAKAWRARDRFQPETNMKAWLFTILRNTFYSAERRDWREVTWDAEKGEAISTPGGEQGWSMDLSDIARALHGLPDTQREAVLLVGVAGFTYGDAGRICGRPAGTMKSRTSRGRASLLKMLDGSEVIPGRAIARADHASEDILAQLSTIVEAGKRRAASHS